MSKLLNFPEPAQETMATGFLYSQGRWEASWRQDMKHALYPVRTPFHDEGVIIEAQSPPSVWKELACVGMGTRGGQASTQAPEMKQ